MHSTVVFAAKVNKHARDNFTFLSSFLGIAKDGTGARFVESLDPRLKAHRPSTHPYKTTLLLLLLPSLHPLPLGPASSLELISATYCRQDMVFPLLQCPACDDIITQPTTLICGHTVCSKHVLLIPTHGAEHHFEPSSSASTNKSAVGALPQQQQQLPSCPILTCYTPSGARPLRRQYDLPPYSLSSFSSANSTDGVDVNNPTATTDDVRTNEYNDPVYPQVLYTPPPSDQAHMRTPPPPIAQVKVPHPRVDVTLSRVLDVLGRFVDFSTMRAQESEQGVDSSVHIEREESVGAKRAATPPGITAIRKGVHELRVTSRSSSPSPLALSQAQARLQSQRSQSVLSDVEEKSELPVPSNEKYAHNLDTTLSEKTPLPDMDTAIVPDAHLDREALPASRPAKRRRTRSPPSKPSSVSFDFDTNATSSSADPSPRTSAEHPIGVHHMSPLGHIDSETKTHPTPGILVAMHLDKLMQDQEKKDALCETLLPEVTCEICYQLFFDPVTTPCQHVSFYVLRSIASSFSPLDVSKILAREQDY